jgi:beta-lactamase class C
MTTRRIFLQMTGGLAGSLVVGRRARAKDEDPFQLIQARIDEHHRTALKDHRANVGVVVGVVTPDKRQILYAGREALTNPFGSRLNLNERTPFEIGSISKVFTSAIHYMLHGPYGGTLGTWLGSRMTMSRAVAEISLRNLAIYQPGFAQDNRGGVYPPRMMENLKDLFAYMATFAPPFQQGTCYAYSNIGWSLLGMAALRLNSHDTQAFARAYNEKLVKFCGGFSATDTQVFHADLKPRLPMGYTAKFVSLPSSRNYQPSREAGYGSGGIVSNGADMMQFLLYNMGRLPGGLTAPALAYQQTETFRAAPCSGEGPGPVTSYGWFHRELETPRGKVVVLNKNGGVAGFTSWMGFTSWQGTGAPSSHGVFVLSNGPNTTRIGNNAMKLLLETQSGK